MNSVPSSLTEEFYQAGQQLLTAPTERLSAELNNQLNGVLGWPFRAIEGCAVDSHDQLSPRFGSIIYTEQQGIDVGEAPVTVPADTLACAIDIYETLGLKELAEAHHRIAVTKQLKKAPAAKGVVHTTITLGVIFARTAALSLEKLGEELDRLNRQIPSAQWPDMVVIASQGVLNYAVQFPGEPTISGDFMPPAEGALNAYIPAIYVVMIIKPDEKFTFNKMMSFLLGHLAIFSPGAKLPPRDAITEGIENSALTLMGYQYNLAGNLCPVPEELYIGRHIPPRPYFVQDPDGTVLASLQFLPWQDGGAIICKGKLPLEGLMVFLQGIDFKKAGIIRREDRQVSYVLPITPIHFSSMLQRLEQRSNMRVRNDLGKFVIQKYADEGSRSPFIARLFIGMLRLADTLGAEKPNFEAAYHQLLTALMGARTTAKEVSDLLTEHTQKLATGEIVRVQGQTIHIDVSIDRELNRKVEDFINGASRSFKDRMQRVVQTLGVNIGFLYKKQSTFEAGLAAYQAVDPLLADYLREVRPWSDTLVRVRNALEHDGWRLPAIIYSDDHGAVQFAVPQIEGRPVTDFINGILDRLVCFVEEVTVHCIKGRMPNGFSVHEMPTAQRPAEIPLRFQTTLAAGGSEVWQIGYHESTFDDT